MDNPLTLSHVLNKHKAVYHDLPRVDAIVHAVDNKEALVAANGCLATWTPTESTGRSPLDTYLVEENTYTDKIDWTSPNNIPMREDTFDLLWQDALDTMTTKDKLYVTDRAVGADARYALPVRTVSDQALTALFTLNMFRPLPEDIVNSIFHTQGFTLLVLPYDKLNKEKYKGHLRRLANGDTSDMAIAMHFAKRRGVVYGSAYGGSVKKLIFTVMNFYLPLAGILPIHCSSNENAKGELALLLGLSGTGKTTLSADASRALLGDDEHGWSDAGIANFENGCYAKLIDLNPKKEPEIYSAVFHEDDYTRHGAIVENAMMYPNGRFDLSDKRITPNSRASYPLRFLANVKESSTGNHPKTILFLTADANGIIPPVSRLNADQAMLWFLMGYTSKLAGTETGIVDPVSTFSRFFGQPFMPCLPHMYSDMLGEKMQKQGTRVFLINTGWSGGPYGVGKRIDITLTRRMVNAALDGELEHVTFRHDPLFHLDVPETCPGVPQDVLNPINTWPNKEEYHKRAKKLAADFSRFFDKAYGDKDISASVRGQCPGK